MFHPSVARRRASEPAHLGSGVVSQAAISRREGRLQMASSMLSYAKKKLRSWVRSSPPGPPIRLQSLASLRPDLHLASSPQDDSRNLVSQLCRFGTLDSATFRGWIEQLHEPWRPHRKLWELAFICQALDERDMLRPGRRGLGFAVGAEKLPALFAARGCTITATDLPSDDDRRTPWAQTGQWVGDCERLNEHGLCDASTFRESVTYRPVDMNEVPNDLTGFDFTWSTCSFEHCGSLELGLRFLERQMDCLKPGGVAVHTTEFNLSSNDDTVTSGAFVIYRLRDIEEFCGRVIDAGHSVEPLDLRVGDHHLDWFVDEPPYHDIQTAPAAAVKHLRLNLIGHASTSIALVIRKAA